MNVLLLFERDLLAPTRAKVAGRRASHVRRVLGKGVGDHLLVGIVNGGLGQGRIVALDGDEMTLEFETDRDAPPPSPVTLVLALPRPPMLRRVLQTAATCGVKSIHLIHARRVEKSFWQSSALAPTELEEQLALGLEQGRDTVMPRVHCHRRFRPFAEDALPDLVTGGMGLLADGDAAEACPASVTEAVVLAVGPEGGFVDFERELLERNGLRPVHVGARPLRVDVAVAALLGRLA